MTLWGFKGPDYTVDLDECLSGHRDPCGHRGVCNNTLGSYECSCLSGWTGQRCDNRSSENANCMPGYYGEYCLNTTCDHGYPDPEMTTGTSVTSSILSSVVCECDDGWTKNRSDSRCNVDINECITMPSPCLHGGTCNNTIGSYYCECTELWGGFNCSEYVTTTTEAITAEETTVTLFEQTKTEARPLNSDTKTDLTTTAFYATDPIENNSNESTWPSTTANAQLHTVDAHETTNYSIDTASPAYSLPLTDSRSTEALRSTFVTHRTTLGMATRPSLTTVPSDREYEQESRAKLEIWMIALLSVGGVLGCVLIVALFVLKYKYSDSFGNTMCSKRKRKSNKVDVSLACMKSHGDLNENKRQEVC